MERTGPKMKMVCSYCGKDMGEKDGGGVEGVSHGICEECLKKLQTEVESNVGRNNKEPRGI